MNGQGLGVGRVGLPGMMTVMVGIGTSTFLAFKKNRRTFRSRERVGRRDRMSPDYQQRDSWSYSYTMSPKAPPKKEKNKEKDRESGEGGRVKAEGRVKGEGRSRSLEQGEVVVNGDGVMKEE